MHVVVFTGCILLEKVSFRDGFLSAAFRNLVILFIDFRIHCITISPTVLKGKFKFGHDTFSDIHPALGTACAHCYKHIEIKVQKETDQSDLD